MTKREIVLIALMCIGVVSLGAFQQISRPNHSFDVAASAGAATPYTISSNSTDKISCSWFISNDSTTSSDTLTYEVRIGGQTSYESAITVLAGETISYSEDDGVCISHIRTTAGSGTPAFRIVANVQP